MTVLLLNVLFAQIIVKAAFRLHNVKHVKMDIISMIRKNAKFVELLAVIVLVPVIALNVKVHTS